MEVESLIQLMQAELERARSLYQRDCRSGGGADFQLGRLSGIDICIRILKSEETATDGQEEKDS